MTWSPLTCKVGGHREQAVNHGPGYEGLNATAAAAYEALVTHPDIDAWHDILSSIPQSVIIRVIHTWKTICRIRPFRRPVTTCTGFKQSYAICISDCLGCREGNSNWNTGIFYRRADSEMQPCSLRPLHVQHPSPLSAWCSGRKSCINCVSCQACKLVPYLQASQRLRNLGT